MAEADTISDDDRVADPKVQQALELMTKTLEEFTAAMRSIDPDFDKHPIPDDPGAPISADEIDRMCSGYFQYHEYIARGYIDQAPDHLVRVSDDIMEMSDNNPERLWSLLLELVQRAPSDEVRMFVAAGPLENVVRWHGEHFLERLEAQSIFSKHFHHAMRGVWGWQDLPGHVRDRLFAVLTPEWEEFADRQAGMS